MNCLGFLIIAQAIRIHVKNPFTWYGGSFPWTHMHVHGAGRRQMVVPLHVGFSPDASQDQPDGKFEQQFHYEGAQQQKRVESFALEQWSS